MVVLDDFTEGPYSAELVVGQMSDYQSGDPGRLVGGVRSTWFGAWSLPHHPGTFSVGDGRLVVGTGVDGYHRLEVGHGYVAGGAKPLGLDLSGCREMVVDFQFLDLGLNFNVLVFTGSGSSQHAVNLNPGTYPFGHRFSLDPKDLGGAADPPRRRAGPVGRRAAGLAVADQTASGAGAMPRTRGGVRVLAVHIQSGDSRGGEA
jgi:hypothetical protein